MSTIDGFIHYLAYGIIRHYANVCINALPLQRQEVWHAVDSLQDFHPVPWTYLVPCALSGVTFETSGELAIRLRIAAITAIHGIR